MGFGIATTTKTAKTRNKNFPPKNDGMYRDEKSTETRHHSEWMNKEFYTHSYIPRSILVTSYIDSLWNVGMGIEFLILPF